MIGGRKFIVTMVGMVLMVIQPDVAAHLAIIASAYIAGNAVLSKARVEANSESGETESEMTIGFRDDGIVVDDDEEEEAAP